MIKRLFSNFPLKLISVVIGILIWLAVVNVEDPIITRTFSGVPVSISNESYVESAGLMCMVEDDSDEISVVVSGKRSIVEKMKAADIDAEADLTQIVDMNTTPVMVPITVSSARITSENMTPQPGNLRILLEDMTTQEYVITTSTGDTSPYEGYEVGKIYADPSKVRITGPQSLIQKIDQVVARVNVFNLHEDTSLEENLVIVDKNGDELTDTQMSYLKYDIGSPEVTVYIDLWDVVNDVSLTADYEGTPKAGYRVDEITLTPDITSVAGTDEALATLAQNNNTIAIPASMLNVEGMDEDLETMVDLNDILPDGLMLTTGTNESVSVTVSIMEQNSKKFTIATKNITSRHLDDSLQVVYDVDSVEIRIRETTGNIADLKDDQIKASVNFSEKTAGSYDMPVKITLPEGYEVVDDPTVSVTLVGNVGSVDSD